MSNLEKNEKPKRAQELEDDLQNFPPEFGAAFVHDYYAERAALGSQAGPLAASKYQELHDTSKIISEMLQYGLIEKIPDKNAYYNPFSREASE
jgi:hypothetical protein